MGRPYRHDPQEVRKAAFALRAAQAEYLRSSDRLRIRSRNHHIRFIYGAHLTELERLDERLGSAIEHQQRLNDAYNAGVE